MNTGGFDFPPSFPGAPGGDRLAALLSGGAGHGKLDLFLHLLANLSRSILLLGGHGSGKTSLLRQVQARAQKNWVVCPLTATASLSLERISAELLQALRAPGQAAANANAESELAEQLELLSRQNRRLILLLDDAGLLLPGLLGAVCQFARLHPSLSLAFALRPEDLARKAASDALALADAHVLELAPESPCGPASAAPPAPAGAASFARTLDAVLVGRKGTAMRRPVGGMLLTAVAAAVVAGFVVNKLWRDEPAQPVAEARPMAPSVPPLAGSESFRAEEAVPPQGSLTTPEPVPSVSIPAETPVAASPVAVVDTPPPAANQTLVPATPLPVVTAAPVPPPPTASPAPSPSPTPTPVAERPVAEWVGSASASRVPVFVALFQRWGVAAPAPFGDECAYAKNRGLRCLELHSDWQQLRSLNRPALLELVLPGGSKRYIALTGLENDEAVVESEGQVHRAPPTDISPYWRGAALILWKPPFDKASIGLRERGETARWIRQRLDIPAPPGLEAVYDERVQSRVRAFQKQQGLLADGRAGALTLHYLQLLDDAPDAPKLWGAPRHDAAPASPPAEQP